MESRLPGSEYTGSSNSLVGNTWGNQIFLLPGNEFTRESTIPCVENSEYTGESNLRLCGSEYIGESPFKSNNFSIIVLKSKLFLRMSNGTRRSSLTKKQTQKSLDTIPLTCQLKDCCVQEGDCTSDLSGWSLSRH
jgi:hypothetical protein